MRRVPAGAGEQERAGQYGCPSGELPGGAEAAGADRPHNGGRGRAKSRRTGWADSVCRRGKAGGGLRRGRTDAVGRGQGAAKAGARPAGRAAAAHSAYGYLGIKGPAAGNDADGDRTQCDRLWRFCGHWGSPGRAGAYFSDFQQISQASLRGCLCGGCGQGGCVGGG